MAKSPTRNQEWPAVKLTKAECNLLYSVLMTRRMVFSDWIVEKAREDQDLILKVASTISVCPKCGGWLKGGECENCVLP